MNDQPLNNTPFDRREARRQRRSVSGGGWIIGIILIVLGGLFLAQNMGVYNLPLNNWWALFILIPAVGAFERSLHLYRAANNQITAQAGGAAVLGLLLTLVTVGFLLNLGWSIFGPILIILAGLGILLNNMFGKKE